MIIILIVHTLWNIRKVTGLRLREHRAKEEMGSEEKGRILLNGEVRVGLTKEATF